MTQEQQYLDLLSDVLANGSDKSVFGNEEVFVRSVFGRQLRFNLADGFPIYTTKKVFYRGAFEEMLWFIKGTGNITELISKNVNIWNEWGYKVFKQGNVQQLTLPITSTQEEFVSYLKETNKPFIIPIHYTNFTKWNGYLNQMDWVVNNLPKNPDRKSYYVTCWNPEQAYQMSEQSGKPSVVLVACHTDHIINITDGKLNLRVTIRSNDLLLGNPFNVCQYAMLQHMYSFLCGYPVGDLVINIDDAHIYSNHFDQVREQISRQGLGFPSLTVKNRGQQKMEDFVSSDFVVNNYNCHSSIKAGITVVGGY